MRLEVRHGRVPSPPSGHGSPQGAGPPVPAPVDPRDVQLRPEASPLLALLSLYELLRKRTETDVAFTREYT